jgi:hypothetical protein
MTIGLDNLLGTCETRQTNVISKDKTSDPILKNKKQKKKVEIFKNLFFTFELNSHVYFFPWKCTFTLYSLGYFQFSTYAL